VKELDWTGVPPDRQPETRRRIEILERFLAISKPTPAQRRQARDELGVSRPMFYVLLEAWTRNRRPADLPGAKKWKSGPRRNRAGTAVHEDKPDFANPRPLDCIDWNVIPEGRRAEVRRRVEIVDRYLALPNPSPEDRARAMAAIGVGKATFQSLVTTWRRTRDPTQVAGARRSPGPGGRRLQPEVEAILAEILCAVGASAGEAHVLDEVTRRCLAAALPVPSRETIQERCRRARVTRRHEP
jgi:hypothetical protein